MLEIRCSPGVWSKSSERSIFIIEYVSVRELVDNFPCDWWVKVQSSCFYCSCSWVCSSRMEAMRTCSKSCLVSVREVVEPCSIYLKVFGSHSYNSSASRSLSLWVTVWWYSDHKCVYYLSCTICSIFGHWDFNSCKKVVSYFEINEPHISYLFKDRTVFCVFPACVVYEICCH